MSVSSTDLMTMESGLQAAMATLEKKLSAEISKAGAAKGVPDASTLLGLDFQAKQYDHRRTALLDPKTYASDRSRAFNTMKGDINTKYTQSLNSYLQAGMPPEMAKKFALQAASNESAIQQQVFELTFPSGANALELNAQTEEMSGLARGAQPAARLRAPARRRTRRR